MSRFTHDKMMLCGKLLLQGIIAIVRSKIDKMQMPALLV